MSYKNEAAFSKALVTALRKAKTPLVQRIESASTGVGIPDMYMINAKRHHIWLELKNSAGQEVQWSSWHVGWRPGQQAWAQQYWKAIGDCTYTVVALSNGFIIVPMTKVFKNNFVTLDYVGCYITLQDLIQALQEL